MQSNKDKKASCAKDKYSYDCKQIIYLLSMPARGIIYRLNNIVPRNHVFMTLLPIAQCFLCSRVTGTGNAILVAYDSSNMNETKH